jgi:hypothetical protein
MGQCLLRIRGIDYRYHSVDLKFSLADNYGNEIPVPTDEIRTLRERIGLRHDIFASVIADFLWVYGNHPDA